MYFFMLPFTGLKPLVADVYLAVKVLMTKRLSAYCTTKIQLKFRIKNYSHLFFKIYFLSPRQVSNLQPFYN